MRFITAVVHERARGARDTTSPTFGPVLAHTGKATTFAPAERLKGFDAPTVWHEFTPLAKEMGGATGNAVVRRGGR